MYKKRWRVGLSLLCAAACACGLAGSFPARAESGSPGTLSSLSAVLYEPESGRVLYEKDAHTPRPMASTTKLMTALLAMENAEPDQNVVATKEAVTVEGSALGLRAGDNISMRDLVTGLLLESGNDAANTIALTLDSSLPAFAERMNRKAAELGMQDSHFVTPSGLDEGNHSASAYDMALLGAAVMREPELASIVGKKSAVIEMGNPKRKVTVSNHNRLLSLYGPAVGMKTGFTKKSGKCLVSAAEKDGVLLIAVTLNGGDYWNDHIKLYEYGFGRTESVTPEAPALSPLPVAGGMTGAVQLETEAPPAAVLLKGEKDAIETAIELPPFVWAPVAAGDAVGAVHYRVGERELYTLPIRACHAVGERPVAAYRERMMRWFFRLLEGLFG